jgi:hypothetical protein
MREKRRAQILVIAMAFNYPAGRKFQEVRTRIGSKREQCLQGPDFSQRSANL